jgi:hypothetical protein
MKDLRAMGYLVQDLSQVGGGVPDLLLGTPCRGHLFLCEVKDPSKPPSKRSLTDDQKRWHWDWRGLPVLTALSAADVHEKISGWLDSLATR